LRDGRIERCRLRDPSWFQWPLLEAAIENNIVADFPLCNKSFNCSYSGLSPSPMTMLGGVLALLERVDAGAPSCPESASDGAVVLGSSRASRQPRIHRARSAARKEDSLGWRIVFILCFATCSLSRTPRPPAGLATPGLINSIPAFSRAEISFMRESTLARMTPSLASMR
jgi:hypothetical protein